MTRLALATRTPGPLADLTSKRRALTIGAYPLGRAVLLRAEGDVRGLDAFEWGAPVRHASREPRALTLLLDANPDVDVAGLVAASGARIVPPIVWARGEARVELDVEAGADAAKVRALFPHARVLAKREAPRDVEVLPGLTTKQATAISTAYEMGYYESPKRATTGEVAKRLGLARSTFEGHLSRAEKALLGAMMPVARARLDPAQHGLEAMRVVGAFSDALGVFVRMELSGDAVRRVELRTRGEPVGSDPLLDRVLDALKGGRDDLADVPVDLDVSAFERRVLDELRKVPPGETVTYAELARRIGAPGAARAVGNACARNPALVVIPCHRVVPATGGYGNYAGAGGARTKAKLLEREKRRSGLGKGGPGENPE